MGVRPRAWPLMIVLAAVPALMPSCVCVYGDEGVYVHAAEAYVHRGPAFVCCSGTRDSADHGEACRAHAGKTCGFLEKADLQSRVTMRLGDDDGAVVEVIAREANGPGRCKVQMQVMKESAFSTNLQGSGCTAF